MIGCMILGGLAALGIARLMHGRFHGRCHWHGRGWHGRCGGGGGDPYGPHFGDPDGWRGRSGMPFFLRFLSDRLEATPAQERAMSAAFAEAHAEIRELRGEAAKSRADVAAALRKPVFDEVLFGELFARHDTAIEKARKAFVGLGARVHEALDDRQRERLAALLERGPRFVSPGFGW